MPTKVYTAQEMREASLWFYYPPNSTEEAKCFDRIEISAMLRQAADMRERIEEKLKELDEEYFFDGADNLTLPMEECYRMLDYILRGDEGKDAR